MVSDQPDEGNGLFSVSHLTVYSIYQTSLLGLQQQLHPCLEYFALINQIFGGEQRSRISGDRPQGLNEDGKRFKTRKFDIRILASPIINLCDI